VSTRLFFERVRRSIGREQGVVGASGMPPAVEGRLDDFRLTSSKVLENASLTVHEVGPPCASPEPVAFLDGAQRYEVVGYLDTMPVVAGILSAAVRLRTGGSFRTVERAERRVLVGRAEALAALGTPIPGVEPIVVEGEDRLHPLKELENARRIIDAARTALEHELGARFRRSHRGWLVVDGVISDTPIWTTDEKVVGVSKSHATLPFDGEQLSRYLTLPSGHRTSIFEPTTWRFAPVHSWGLRLWPFEGNDLLHGLIRVEVAPGAVDGRRADELSRWLLAERVPLSRPDPRWDRLLYGVASVERHLRAR
jgi:hypothetical protein